MPDNLLKQEEIDALLNAKVFETVQNGNAAEPMKEEGTVESAAGENEAAESESAAGLPAQERLKTEPALSDEEKDALGEIGNICMGSAATTLSMLLNQKVSITSPSVDITTMEELFKEFVIPHVTIYVRFTEGLSGYNLLIMRMKDAAVMADLMMGGDGTNVAEELDEIGISAASEAMNQMIGSASTSMSTMFSRKVNISPPEIKVFKSPDDQMPQELKQEGQVVVVRFKMIVGELLDTQIMQVMGVETAKEEAALLFEQMLGGGEKEKADKEPQGRETEAVVAADAQEAGKEYEGFAAQDSPGLAPERPAVQPGAAGQRQAVPPAAEPQDLAAGAGVETPAARWTAAAPPAIDQQRLDLILDIPLKVTVLLGRTKWPIKDILGLAPGSVVELQNLVDEPVEVLVNGTLVALGEVVVVNENFGVRITSIVSREERLKNLGK